MGTRREPETVAWRAFWAAFLGWALDGFDFTILTFVLVDIERSFSVNRALAGALGTITLATRLVGGTGAGALADQRGRRIALVLSLVWFSLFAGLSGLSTSYRMLFALRALFGIGMGGVWAAGMPLALEHWPKRHRGLASGVLQSGYPFGYVLAALVFQFVYPLVTSRNALGWRVLFWVGAVPGFVVAWVARGIPESPVWLVHRRTQREAEPAPAGAAGGFGRLFQSDLVGTTVHTSLLVGLFMCSYYSVTFWYASFLRETRRAALPYLVALNVGTMLGDALWGAVSETGLGRRGAVTVAALLGVSLVPLYLHTSGSAALAGGALLMGVAGTGVFGVAPSYLAERYPTEVRGIGVGLAYHAGAALGAVVPTLIGALQDAGWTVADAMSLGIAVFGVLTTVVVWLGPETRGWRLSTGQEEANEVD